jgi:hypothetical protein
MAGHVFSYKLLCRICLHTVLGLCAALSAGQIERVGAFDILIEIGNGVPIMCKKMSILLSSLMKLCFVFVIS